MHNSLDYATLKGKQQAIPSAFPETTGLRVHSAINWVSRAEDCGDEDDPRFVFLWISFNAAYANECVPQMIASGEHVALIEYFPKFVALVDGSTYMMPHGNSSRRL